MSMYLFDAVAELRPGAKFYTRGSKLTWKDSEQTEPTQEEIDTKIAELKSAEPMRLLRITRDIKLTEVDWWTSKALDGIELTQAQKDYRQALRDLPSTAEPTLDENGQLTNVTWPTKPE